MPKGEIVLGTKEHAKELALNLREPDKMEIFRASGTHNAYDCVKMSVKLGGVPYTGLIDGKVACMLGVHRDTHLSTTGTPWLLTTHVVDTAPRVFLRYTKQGMQEILDGWDFDYLVNYVDAEHHEAIRWLEWLGFTIHEAEPWGLFRQPFHKFDMRI
jgi:hypothetical protein